MTEVSIPRKQQIKNLVHRPEQINSCRQSEGSHQSFNIVHEACCDY